MWTYNFDACMCLFSILFFQEIYCVPFKLQWRVSLDFRVLHVYAIRYEYQA